ncbi:hypothetical protein P9112_004790 [Eukaryota sp. TZLM1-RC]
MVNVPEVIVNPPEQSSAFVLALNNRFSTKDTDPENLQSFKERTLIRVRDYVSNQPKEPVQSSTLWVHQRKPQIQYPTLKPKRAHKPKPKATVKHKLNNNDVHSVDFPEVASPTKKPTLSPDAMARRAHERFKIAQSKNRQQVLEAVRQKKAEVPPDIICSCPGSNPFDESGRFCADNCPMKYHVRREAIQLLKQSLREEASAT